MNDYNLMKTFHNASSSNIVAPQKKKLPTSSKGEQGATSKGNNGKGGEKTNGPRTVNQKNVVKDHQQSVRMSLVSLDKNNISNPQLVAHYCKSIFDLYLQDEVT